MSSTKNLILSNGIEMPLIGLGTSAASSESLISAIKIAIKNGYRMIDTAAAYKNEEFIGQALTQCFAEGIVKREEIFITTKCPQNFLHPDKQEKALKESLAKLQIDYVDLYLAHNPCSTDDGIKVENIWEGLEKLYEKKLTKAIGISNFNLNQIQRILKMAKIPIHNIQIEIHLYFQQKELIEFCKNHGISVTAYAPIGSPNREKIKNVDDKNQTTTSKIPLTDPLILELSKKHSKTPAQILLRHLIQNDFAVIPKSTNETRIKENFDIFDFELTNEEMKQLNNVPQKPRTFWLKNFLSGHPEDPFKDERSQSC